MARRRSTGARQAGRLEVLKERLAAARALRWPPSITLVLYRSDDSLAFKAYLGELEATLAKVSPATLLVVVESGAERPAGLIPPWRPGRRAWLDWIPSPQERQHRPDPSDPMPRPDYQPPAPPEGTPVPPAP
jgi:hypothetical protein